MDKQKNKKGNKKQNNKQIANVVKSIVNQNVEKKWINSAAITTSSISPTVYDMTSISTGATIDTRIGNSIRITNIKLKANFLIADTTNIIRLMIVEWFPDTANDTLDYGEVLTDVSSTERSMIAPFIPTKPSKFKIHWDKIIYLDTYHPRESAEFNKKVNIRVAYGNAVNTGVHHLCLMHFSDSAAVSHPGFNYEALLQFVDD